MSTTNPLISTGPPSRSNNVEISWTTLKNMFVLAFGVVMNTASVAAAAVVLLLSKNEVPEFPLRLWIAVYAFLCCVQIFISVVIRLGRPSSDLVADDLSATGKVVVTTNLTVCCIWLLLGLYWVVSGGQMLADNTPKLYWLTVIFVALDTLSIVIVIVVAYCRRLCKISNQAAN